MQSTKDIKQMTVRIPVDTWKQLRRMEEAGIVRSINDAILMGLELLITNKGDVIIKKSDTKE